QLNLDHYEFWLLTS
ncbi:DUF645 family protein, partial [Vibrio cholerae]|nr:DUF645 family protein [Vibrio cholerae]